MTKVKKRPPRNPPAQHAERLLRILEANLANATEPELRDRLRRAINGLNKGTTAA
jgi:hypothetical protein